LESTNKLKKRGKSVQAIIEQKKKNYAQLVKKALIIATSTVILAIIALYAVFTKSGQWLVNDDEFKHVKWVSF
jgi:hypothetical protein